MEAQRNFIDNPFQNFEALLKSERSGHKYIKRTGSSGNYRYYYQQPSAGKGTVKINGDDYSIESQVELQQSPKFAEVADSIFKVTDSKGHASYLMHLKTGKWSHYKNLKQQDASVDGVDSGGSEEPKAEDKEPKPSMKQAVESSKPVEVSDSPRKDGEKAFQDDIAEESYAFARKSKLGPLGEDIPNSARHMRHRFDSLMAAEKAGRGAELVKRDVLLKDVPIDLVSTVTKSNMLAHWIAQTAIEKFPPKPPEVSKGSAFRNWYRAKQDATNEETGAHYKKGEIVNGMAMRSDFRDSNFEQVRDENEVNKKLREDYYNDFQGFIKKAQEVALKGGTDIYEITKELRQHVSDIIRTRDLRETHSPMRDFHVPFHNGTLMPSPRAGKNSVLGSVNEKLKMLKAGGIDAKDLDKMVDVIKELNSGKKLKDIVNIEGEKSGKKKMHIADLYVARERRKGPEFKVGSETRKDYEDYLIKKLGIRGVQPGNSVTDVEREHHFRKLSESFFDLADVLGLPEEMVSFNGRLGMSIGARGRAGSMATYFSEFRTINLNRRNGAGSLAHEWGHFFDNVMADFFMDGTAAKDRSKFRYMSRYAEALTENGLKDLGKEDFHSGIAKAYNQLNVLLTEMKARLVKDKDALETMVLLGSHDRSYWLSNEEMFARTFEIYVRDKLRDQGRENTYLSGMPGYHTLWGTEEESKKLKPHFDTLFAEFKKSEYLKKSMEVFKNDDLKKSIHELIEEIKGKL